jgi:hypothetical protein
MGYHALPWLDDHRHPRRAASMVPISFFFIDIIAWDAGQTWDAADEGQTGRFR